MFRHVPNALTGARLVLAVVFFVLLSFYQYEGRGDPLRLNIAFFVYLVALVTDFLDGYLARRWKVEGAFGRVVDPFCDKILVLGSFIFFAGKNFIIQDPIASKATHIPVVTTISGVAPAVVVILLARELLVTTLRGVAEGEGKAFGAVWAGKFKMVVQSVTILVILVYVNYLPQLKAAGYEPPARFVRNFCVWTTVIVTVWSGLTYVKSAVTLYTAGPGSKPKTPTPPPPLAPAASS